MNNYFPVHGNIISKEILNVNLHRDFVFKHNRDMETLAKRLSDTRKERGLSQAELAKKAGLKNQSNIANLESGHRKSSTYIPAIAEALGVEPLWLSEGKLPKEKIIKALDFDESLLEMLGIPKDQVTVDLIRDIKQFVKEPANYRAEGLKSIEVCKTERIKGTGKREQGNNDR